MTEKEAIRAIMKERGWSQQRLADEAGYKHQTNIRSLLDPKKDGMRTDKLYSLVSALGCELVIRDKMGSKKEWVIDMESNSSVYADVPKEIMKRLEGKSEEEIETTLKILGYR